MKKIILTLALFVFSIVVYGQDILITQNDVVYEVKIVDENDNQVMYYLLDDDTKKVRTTSKAAFKEIKPFEIPKNTDLIKIVSSELSGDELYRSIGMYFKGEGYSFESTDKDFLMIKTDAKVFQNNINYWYTISVNNNVVELRAYFFSAVINTVVTGNTNDTNGSRARNAGMKSSALRLPFNIMNDIANGYTATTDASIEYIIEEGK